MNRSTLLTALLPTLVGGCATQYRLPDNVPTATLTVRTASPHNNIPVTSYAKPDCSDKPGTRLAFLNSKAIGTTYSPEATVKVAADRPLIFSIYSLIDLDILRSGNLGVRYSWCTPVMTFAPRPGGRYEAEHSIGRQGCRIDVFEIGETAGSRAKLESATVNTACSQVMEN